MGEEGSRAFVRRPFDTGRLARFEVQAGPYALVHMPRKLPDYVPVSESMFPPFMELDQYGVAAYFSPDDMRSLKIAGTGRGAVNVATWAVRTVLIMNYGKDDEDLLWFWMFLLLGRRFISRTDVLFPYGYFHGVAAPDPAARDVGTGFFRLVRVLDDGSLSAQMRTPMFAPFDTLETIPAPSVVAFSGSSLDSGADSGTALGKLGSAPIG